MLAIPYPRKILRRKRSRRRAPGRRAGREQCNEANSQNSLGEETELHGEHYRSEPPRETLFFSEF